MFHFIKIEKNGESVYVGTDRGVCPPQTAVGQVCLFLCSYVRDEAEAEDIVMGAFADVWARRGESKEHTNLSALLLTAVKNRTLNYSQHREVKMRAEQQLGLLQQEEMRIRISSLEACEPQKLFGDELLDLFYKAVGELPPTSREVFVLSRMEHLPNKEIALRLDISVKTVEFHITRSLKHLRMRMKAIEPSY